MTTLKLVQGDVVLRKIEKMPEGLRKIDGTILQQSETTGHNHHFRPGAKVELYADPKHASAAKTITPDEGKYILVYEDETLYHGKGFDPKPFEKKLGDHDSMPVPAGLYKVTIVREFDPFTQLARQVRD